jgi:DNA-binding IclR family transcriptional regulator
MLDFLGDHPTSDFNITEIAQRTELSRATVYKVLDDLAAVGMVGHTRHVGQSKMYQIDVDHDVVQSILRADMASARHARASVGGR